MKIIMEKIICLIISFVICFNTFAAVVSDNDGSAFITKSEFDSLKNDFQSKLDSYNTSIDSKIDNAIASYLSGVKMDTTFVIDTNFSTLDYPITIIDKRKIIEEVTTSATAAYNKDTLWAPGYYFVASAMRDAKVVTQEFSWSCVDNIKNYLNGIANTADGTFKVDDLLCDPYLAFSTAVHHENYNGKGQAYTTIFLDQSGTLTSGQHRDGPVTRLYIRDNYALNLKVSNYNPVFQGIHHPGGTMSFPNAGQAKYDKIQNADNAMWDSRAAGPFDCSSMLTKETYRYSNKKLNIVYNYGDSTHTSHFAPVAYENEIYITNKKANRKGYQNKSKDVWSGRSKATSNTGVNYIVSEGINLEHENENTSRWWYNKSLISQDRLIYDARTTDGRVLKNHKMVNGIPIFEYRDKQNEDNGKIKDIYVQFSISSNTASNAKYAILSFNPITTQVYSDDVESNPDYIVITNLNGSANDTKKVKLVEGINKLKINNMNSKNILFLKILWNDSSEESITMTKPSITYTKTE